MRTICFYFQVHQPYRIKPYRFFDIGDDHHYWDDFSNRSIMRKVSEKCYLPMNALLIRLIEKYEGKFKVSFSISGTALDLSEAYAHDVLESFHKLVATDNVELMNETYTHYVSSIKSKADCLDMDEEHQKKLKSL